MELCGQPKVDLFDDREVVMRMVQHFLGLQQMFDLEEFIRGMQVLHGQWLMSRCAEMQESPE